MAPQCDQVGGEFPSSGRRDQRQILDDAVTRGLLSANPARHAVPPRHRRDQHRRRMAWTAHELGTFLTGIAGHRHHRTWWLAAWPLLLRAS